MPGEDVKPILGLDDWIFDISITAQRPDCQSILGIAREVAAVLDREFQMPALDYTETPVKKDDFTVTVEAQDICPRYMAHYVYDVEVSWRISLMDEKKTGIGRTGCHFQCGGYYQLCDAAKMDSSMHAFDCDYLEGNAICVRRAREEEKIVTLDKQEYTLNPNNLVICDGVKPVALAGVMGGLNSEIRDTHKGGYV